MWVLRWMVLVILLPGRIWAMPEPPPPGDFPGAQYIDRSGCVFVRKGEAWEPRTDKQGAPICGFPPSLPALADTTPVDAPPSPEEALAEVLAQGLKSGDLVTDVPATPMADIVPDPAQAVLDATLQDQIDIEARLRSAMAGQAPDGLCARLGYRPGVGPTAIIGGDVTQGLCPGMTAPEPMPQWKLKHPTMWQPIPRPARLYARVNRGLGLPRSSLAGRQSPRLRNQPWSR
jgi:hypothetical protein